jgi:hypothetical protein
MSIEPFYMGEYLGASFLGPTNVLFFKKKHSLTLLTKGVLLVFTSYPADKKSTSGKLRILYEGFPMAFLTEQVRDG